MGLTIALLYVLAGPLNAEYLNLVATADATTVYFQMYAAPGSTAWYAIHWTEAGLVTEPVADRIADISDSGAVMASSSVVYRSCRTMGSSCLLQAGCIASWSLKGPGIDVRNDRLRTFLRMNRTGTLLWFEQDVLCDGPLSPTPPTLNGVYEAATLRQVAAAEGRTPASRRYGRRLITDTGRALVFSMEQLHWLDRAGAAPIRHVNRAWEAVTDAAGENIVYVEEEVGELHWISSGGDFRLGLVGSAPALTADGSAMFYLDTEGALIRYDARTHTALRLNDQTYRTFSLATDFVFAITTTGRIVRIDPTSGDTVVWQEAMPEIAAFDHEFAPFLIYCPLVCYYESQGWSLWLQDGKRVRVFGRNLSQDGWRIDGQSWNVPLHPVSEEEAWFDPPAGVSRAPQEWILYHPERAVRFRIPVNRR